MEKKILQGINGGLVIVKEVEELTYEEAMKLYEHFKENLVVLEKFLFKKDESTATDTTPTDQTQTTAVDQGQTTQTDQSQSIPVNQPTADPAPAAPVEQPVPTVDANGNPIQTAPAVDQSQAQPQEQPVIQPLQ